MEPMTLFLCDRHPCTASHSLATAACSGFNSIDCEGCIPDPINHAKFVRDLYELANDTGGKYSVPVLWDKKEKTIVNNESSDILRMFNRDVCHVAHEVRP